VCSSDLVRSARPRASSASQATAASCSSGAAPGEPPRSPRARGGAARPHRTPGAPRRSAPRGRTGRPRAPPTPFECARSRRPSAGRGRRYAARTPAAPEGAPRSRAHSPRRVGRRRAPARPRRRSRPAHERRPSRSPIRFRGRSPRSLAYSARSWATASFQVSCSPSTSPVDRFTTAYFQPRFSMSQGIDRPPSYVVRCGEDPTALPEIAVQPLSEPVRADPYRVDLVAPLTAPRPLGQTHARDPRILLEDHPPVALPLLPGPKGDDVQRRPHGAESREHGAEPHIQFVRVSPPRSVVAIVAGIRRRLDVRDRRLPLLGGPAHLRRDLRQPHVDRVARVGRDEEHASERPERGHEFRPDLASELIEPV